MRDTGRSRVYSGEHRLERLIEWCNGPDGPTCACIGGSQVVLPDQRRFASLESIQAYCDKVLALRQYAGTRPVRVRERKGERAAHYEWGTIAINTTGSRWAMTEVTVLHELAHHLTPGARHGLAWRNAFLGLLESCMGPEVAFALRVLWSEEGVPLAA